MRPYLQYILPTLLLLLTFSSNILAIEIARYQEYSWIDAFDRSPSPASHVETNALGGGAMQVPVNGNTKGWWARWLAVGGEGDVVVHLSAANLTLPHRPAAFPARTNPPFTLPLSGELVTFASLPPPKEFDHLYQDQTLDSDKETQACIPASELRWTPPSEPYKIALVQRGGCDFATKVRAAQERGAAGVIVGDMISHPGETEEEGREREALITMFSPEEDTENIFIPSVFVSRASYLLLRDMLARGKDSGRDEAGLWIELGRAEQDSGSLLSFALLMPSLFLCATIAIHRVRVARQRDADRAPPMIVLSLPERIWTPDIVWEKDDSSSEPESPTPKSPTSPTPKSPTTASRPPFHSMHSSVLGLPVTSTSTLPPPPPISSSEIADPESVPSTSTKAGKVRTKSKSQKYFSKDECAICMDSFQRGEVVRILPCGHVFHKDECDEWLMKWRKLCPTCRADVTLPPGAPLQGATLTPIAPVESSDEDRENPSITIPIRRMWRSVQGLFTRNRTINPDPEADADVDVNENTPLVPTTPRRSDRAV